MRWFGRAEAPAAFRWFIPDGDLGSPTARFSIRGIIREKAGGVDHGHPTLPVLVRSTQGGVDRKQRFARDVYYQSPQRMMAPRFSPNVAPVPAVKLGHVARAPVTRAHGRLRRGGQHQVRWPRAQIVYPQFPKR